MSYKIFLIGIIQKFLRGCWCEPLPKVWVINTLVLCTLVVCCHTFGSGHTNNLLGILHCSLSLFMCLCCVWMWDSTTRILGTCEVAVDISDFHVVGWTNLSPRGSLPLFLSPCAKVQTGLRFLHTAQSLEGGGDPHFSALVLAWCFRCSRGTDV